MDVLHSVRGLTRTSLVTPFRSERATVLVLIPYVANTNNQLTLHTPPLRASVSEVVLQDVQPIQKGIQNGKAKTEYRNY